jgi:hypothetical protein
MAGAPRFAITFVDGTTEIVARRPVHLMRAERLVGKDPGANEHLLATLWACATGGKAPRAEFEKWAETVEDWELVKGDQADDGNEAPLDPAPDASLD